MYRIRGLVKKDFVLIRRYTWLLAIYAIAFSESYKKIIRLLFTACFPA